jgi:DNA-binding CsgD family transcriptional regulator
VPCPDARHDVVGLGKVPAVDLFVERASAVRPGFRLEDCAAAVASICRRLDGLPLAIELAAAQTSTLSPAEIDQRLAVGHGLLDGAGRAGGDGAGDAAGRRQTMEATLDWSHGLLTEAEQVTFRRLSVFAGGWTLEAAEQVCSAGTDPVTTTRALIALTEASLVVRDGDGEARRFRMLVPVAEYASRLLAASDDLAAMSLAHAQYYLGLVAPPSTDWRVVGPEHLDVIAADHENCLAALRFAEGAGIVPLVLGLDVSLLVFWRVRGLLRSAQRRLEAAMTVVGEEPSRERGLVLAGLAHLGQLRGELDPARGCALEAHAVLEACGDSVGVRTVLGFLGDIAADSGDAGRAREYYTAALDIAEADGSELDRGFCHANLGRLAARGGDLATAERELELARAHLDGGPGWYLAHVLVQLGCIARLRGDLVRADTLLGEALTHLRAYGAAVEAVACLDELARLALDRQDPQRATTLFSAADSLRDATAVAVRAPERQAVAADVERARSGLAAGEFAEAWGRGRGLSLEQAAALAAAPDGEGAGVRSSPGAPLTPREREVAALVAEGLSNADIAERLTIAPGTARIHVERILGKRGLTSRVQIAAWMLRSGYSVDEA